MGISFNFAGFGDWVSFLISELGKIHYKLSLVLRSDSAISISKFQPVEGLRE